MQAETEQESNAIPARMSSETGSPSGSSPPSGVQLSSLGRQKRPSLATNTRAETKQEFSAMPAKTPSLEAEIVGFLEEYQSDMDHPPLSLTGVTPEHFDDFCLTPTGIKITGMDAESHVYVSYNSRTHTLRIRTASTPMHEAFVEWFGKCLLTSETLRPVESLIHVGHNQTFFNFAPPYEETEKVPNLFVRVRKDDWPSVVVEGGWTEIYPDLIEDIKIWLLGGKRVTEPTEDDMLGGVNAGVLVTFDHREFDKDKNRSFIGRIEVWKRKQGVEGEIEKTYETVRCSSIPSKEIFTFL